MTKDEAPTSPKDAALKLALEALEDLLDQTEPPPDTNCSCHICPPCNDCVDYSGVRYAIEQANKTITAIKEALAQPEQERFHVATIGNWGRVEWVDGVFPSVGDKMYSAPPQEKNT